MTAAQFNAAVARLGLSQGEAAKLLGVSIRSAHGYANGATIPEPVARLLRLVIRLNIKLEQVR